MGQLGCIVLAAGESKRFKSKLPKPLHCLCGRPLIDHVLQTVSELDCYRTAVVVGVGREQMVAHLEGHEVQTAVQAEQLGTGHAVMCAQPLFENFDGPILVTCADVPLIRPQTLQALVDEHQRRNACATVLTAVFDDPTGYGRIVRDDDGLVTSIIEHRDATEEVLAIQEINSGIYIFDTQPLFKTLAEIGPDNDQGEYYLTDIISRFVAAGQPVAALAAQAPQEIIGINDRAQLAEAEAIARHRIRRRLMSEGVTLMDPASTFIDADVHIGRDTVVWPGSFILGKTTIAEDCTIGGHAVIEDCEIAEGTQIRHCSVVRNSTIGRGVTIGAGAFIGSNTTIIAPITIGQGAYVAAGSTINRDVPADALAIGRDRQENKEGYARRLRK